jgi:hypothetical protein
MKTGKQEKNDDFSLTRISFSPSIFLEIISPCLVLILVNELKNKKTLSPVRLPLYHLRKTMRIAFSSLGSKIRDNQYFYNTSSYKKSIFIAQTQKNTLHLVLFFSKTNKKQLNLN